MSFNSGYDLTELLVPTKAAAVYAAQENSLFIPGAIIPMMNVPAGSMSVKAPVFNSVTAETVDTAAHAIEDFTALGVSANDNVLTLELHAARDVIRDLGGVDPAEIGRVLGNAVAAKYDAAAVAALNAATNTHEITSDANLDYLWDAAATIRGNGEMGQLFGIVSPARAAHILKAIGSAAYAGSDAQNEAMRNGFVGMVNGIAMYQSAHMSGEGVIFGADAARTANQGGLNLEIDRRAAAVGFDVVASYAGAAKLIDNDRAVKLIDLV